MANGEKLAIISAKMASIESLAAYLASGVAKSQLINGGVAIMAWRVSWLAAYLHWRSARKISANQPAWQ
jgi:hypothetical protein